jgi:hypothetical protein
MDVLVVVLLLLLLRVVGVALVMIGILSFASIPGHGFVQISVMTVYLGHASSAAEAADHVQKAVKHRSHLWIVMLTLLSRPGIAMIVETVVALHMLLDIGLIGIGVVGSLPLQGR